jgi:hypothetical protein
MGNIPGKPGQQNISDKTTHSLTPHEIVERHMQHPEEPITDVDMENLDLEVNPEEKPGDEIILTPEEKKCADELADAIQSDSTDMSYKADI